jgi:DNA repair protein RadA/Sms
MVEIQALVSQTTQAQPRRSVRGVDAARVHQLLAVLERHCKLKVSDLEVYVNVVGGWRIDEPACDLAVALAIASSVLDVPVGPTAAWGEVGLAGEVRGVPFELRRREEAGRVGVERIIAPGADARMRLPDAVRDSLRSDRA